MNCQPLLVAVYFAHNSQYLLQSKQKIKYFHLDEPDDGGLHLHGPPRRPGVRGLGGAVADQGRGGGGVAAGGGRVGGREEGRQRWIAPRYSKRLAVAQIMGFRPSNIIVVERQRWQEHHERGQSLNLLIENMNFHSNNFVLEY